MGARSFAAFPFGRGAITGTKFPARRGRARGARRHLSHGLWQAHYGGTPEALGTRLIFDGQPFTVIGIARRISNSWEAEVFTPLGAKYAA